MEPDDLDADPVVQFAAWYERREGGAGWVADVAREAGVDLSQDGMDASVCLATADAEGVPDARMVLLKSADARGFAFYTNELSAKGVQLGANPSAALVFLWHPRQVRVRGDVERVADAECDEYWRTRPRGSQLGAWASAQSSVIASRSVLEARLADVTARFDGVDVPRPPYWRGYRVVPDEIEFWMHRDDRLHDRVLYRREVDGSWRRDRLSP